MTPSLQTTQTWDFRLGRKDVGVALVLLAALAVGWVLRMSVENRTAVFQDQATGFTVTYPATWGSTESLRQVMLKVENPATESAFKASLVVDRRGLDTQNPPTLQQLVDRRVAQQGTLTAYHLLSTADATVSGLKSMRQEYAYVVQPIDQARRASVPVVVHAIEYVVIGKDSAYYITLAVPEDEAAGASPLMDSIIRSVKVN
ncbi:MAG: hypothetical protein HZB53_13185 [Chloroflexi bacterium]|nr:hypothetical protein [Chloroflexota bacterium]